MAVVKQQLISRTIYDTDGATTVWDFSFSGGYLDKAHVKAYRTNAVGLRTEIAVNPVTDVIGVFQLRILPALAVGSTLIIYRDTPKNLPLVDFTDEAGFSEIALDTNAKQAVFVAAEAIDTVNSLDINTLIDAAGIAVAQANIATAAAATAVAQAAASANSAFNANNSADIAAFWRNEILALYGNAAALNTAVSNAQAAATTATTRRNEAEVFRNNAATSATNAGASATAASGSSSAANTSAINASASATAASNSSISANNRANDAQTSATASAGSAASALTRANDSNASALSSQTSAGAANTSAVNAAASAAASAANVGLTTTLRAAGSAGTIQSSSVGQVGATKITVRESVGRSSNSAIDGAPALSFEWVGITIGQIRLQPDGRFRLTNGPGTGFARLESGGISANGGAHTPPVALAAQSNPQFDAALTNVFYFSMNQNATPTFINASDGQTIMIRIAQDATGNRTFNLPASVVVDPDTSQRRTSNGVAWLIITWVGSRWEGSWGKV